MEREETAWYKLEVSPGETFSLLLSIFRAVKTARKPAELFPINNLLRIPRESARARVHAVAHHSQPGRIT